MKTTNNYLNSISSQVNSLSSDQLNLLFHVYFQLNLQFDFFMSQQKHSEFMNLYNETFSKNNIYTYRSLINILTTSYTHPSRYPSVLTSIDLIKKDYSLKEIINIQKTTPTFQSIFRVSSYFCLVVFRILRYNFTR